MDPDSAEATALMELAPTPVDITEIKIGRAHV